MYHHSNKILFQINTVGNSGSHGQIAEAIGNVAMEQGWISYIAYGRRPRASKSKLIKIGTKWDIGWHVLQTRLFDRHGFASRRATKILIKRIKAIQPDIIHLHNIHGYYLNIALLFEYLSFANIPVVWTLHDCWPITGHCSHFDFIGCDRWETGCFECPQKNRYPKSILFDRSRKNYHQKKKFFTSISNLTIVPVSKWLGNVVKQSFLQKKTVRVMYNGIDTTLFVPLDVNKMKSKLRLEEKFIILGVASVWDDRKWLNDFVRLSQLLDSQYQIVLVGLTQQQKKTLPPAIIGISQTGNNNQLVEYYSAADVFLNPTLEDTFPTTNLESLACGTPMITYKAGGSPEAIDLTTGIIVEKGDIHGIVNAIKIIYSKGKSFYSSACRAHAVQFFSKEDRFKEYMDLYHELLHEDDNDTIK
jgi:glycosyltransferase involved in cell wall biosynthesis